jgi:hypothetical protein
MSNKKPKRQALYVTGFTTEEKEKLESFSELVGRPSSWIVRDAVKCYISSLEGETEELREKLDAIREKLETVKIDLSDVGHTPIPKIGRPVVDSAPMSEK